MKTLIIAVKFRHLGLLRRLYIPIDEVYVIPRPNNSRRFPEGVERAGDGHVNLIVEDVTTDFLDNPLQTLAPMAGWHAYLNRPSKQSVD